MVLGDFNFHVDNSNDAHVIRLIGLLDQYGFYGFSQYVSGPTHSVGHTLDLVFSLFLLRRMA